MIDLIIASLIWFVPSFWIGKRAAKRAIRNTDTQFPSMAAARYRKDKLTLFWIGFFCSWGWLAAECVIFVIRKTNDLFEKLNNFIMKRID